jgi:hypothetical protein
LATFGNETRTVTKQNTAATSFENQTGDLSESVSCYGIYCILKKQLN